MPLSIPAFDQYQQPLVPLRGLWTRKPVEGDQFVNVEVDWLVTTKSTAVQFSLSGNSPVSLSQICALAVDNGRCGSDVDFVFPDSGWKLTVPAHAQGIYPVFTNALMFYMSASSAAIGDTTVAQIFNSVPPPVQVLATEAQNVAYSGVVALTNGTTQLLPASINGTLDAINLTLQINAAGSASVNLIDGSTPTHYLWTMLIDAPAAQTIPISLSGLNVRFYKGISFVVGGSTLASSNAVINLYYSTP